MKVPPLCLPLIVSVVAALAPTVIGETVKDREGAVRGDKAKMEQDERWIYNDWQRGFAEAKRTGKPLMVVLRCVPCLACAGIDAQVLLQDAELNPLLDRFVCVRLINANSIDLSLFQFDYDLSFSTVFFNADGTVYGRYGSWTHQRAPEDRTVAGFRQAMEKVLALHDSFPVVKAALAGKQPEKMPYATPIEMPTLAGRYGRELDWDGKVVQSCVHCHQVSDAIREDFRAKKQPLPDRWIYPFPAPETIGLTMDPGESAKVRDVAPGSPAAASGLESGDLLLSLEGQPLVSLADLSWALHRAPDAAVLAAEVERAGAKEKVSLILPEGWRQKADISRRVGTWPMRAMATGGLKLADLSAADRSSRGIAGDKLALLVEHAGEYNKHAAAKKAGFRKGDVLVEIAGDSARVGESELIGRILRKHLPGDKLPTVVLRGTERVKLDLPVQ
jgi:serine protease Do